MIIIRGSVRRILKCSVPLPVQSATPGFEATEPVDRPQK